MFDVNDIRKDFPILTQKIYGCDLVYLDNGATAQKPRQVIEKMNYLYTQLNSNIHRGVHSMSEKMTSEYEAARETVRQFINASSAREIVFTSGATMSINTVAYSFGGKFVGQGDEIIVSEMEHHSNIVPWQMLCERKGAVLKVIPFEGNGRLKIEELENFISSKTKIVAVTQASNTLGTLPDLKKIIEVSHKNNVPVLVDGCQGIVHDITDVQALDCDFYAFSAHKLYGPTGIGVLFAKEKWLEAMPPFMGGGDMVDRVSFEKTTYADLPLKFEAGTSNFIGAIGMAEVIKYLNSQDRSAIAAHEKNLLDYATEKLSAISDIKIYGTQLHKCSILCFNITGAHHYDVGMILDKLGVAVRTGTHCAEPVMRHYGLTGMVRASFAMYNTMEEIDRLADGVKKAAAMLKR